MVVERQDECTPTRSRDGQGYVGFFRFHERQVGKIVRGEEAVIACASDVTAM